MAKNTMNDLRDHLFAQLERLGDDTDMENPEIRLREIERSEAIVNVSKSLIETAKVEVQFLKVTDSFKTTSPMLKELTGGDKL